VASQGLAFLVIAGSALVACADSTTEPPPPTVSSIEVTPATATLVSLGETAQLSATARDGNGNAVAGISFTWSSSDEACAAVSSAGLVTSAANGTATITAAAANVSGTASVTVAQLVAIVAVTPSTTTLTSIDETAQLVGSAYDANGHVIAAATFTWESSDENVATVSVAGLVTAVENGTATVTATSDGVASDADVTVAQEVAAVTVTPGTARLTTLEETVQLSAKAEDANGNAIDGKTFTWGSSNESIAAVSSEGLVTAEANGVATITATTDGVGGDAEVTVAQEAATVTVTPATVTFSSFGETTELEATAHDDGGHEITAASFTWESSDESIATVSASGLVTAVANGAAVITATADGVADAVDVTVAQEVAAVSVTPETTSFTALGETAQLTASALDANGHEVAGQDFTWESSDGSVASVSLAGLVTAEANGTATVTATTDGVAGDAEVTVAQEAASIAVSPIGASISGVGATQQFVLEARDAGGSLIPDPSATWSSLNPNVATVDPSTGQATAVESGQVTIAATANGMTGYALLTVAVPGAEPVNLWSEMCSDCGAEGVWGASATDIFATSGGHILHYDGTGWSTMATQAGSFGRGVWGTSATDVYAVFDGIHHYDGTSWSRMEGWTGSDLQAVWGTSPTDIYAVGSAGTILHYDGTTWSTMASGTFGDLQDVWGTSATDIYVVSWDGGIFHYDGTSWTAAYETDMRLRGLWGSSSNDVYAVGRDNAALHYDGTTWSQMPRDPDTYMSAEAVWGTSNTDVYAAGAWGSIFHYDGSNWSEMESGIGEFIMGVWGMSATDVYAVQRVSIILRGVRGATVEITPSAHSLTAGGATVLLAVEARDADDNAISGVRFAWTSSEPSVATVDGTGLVTAVASGTTMITATVPGGAADTATITVDMGQAPTATITSPADGARFAEAATITFSGSGTDPEDGDLTGSALVWTSSLDGQIGIGASFTRDDLSTGTHTIRLTATDSDGGSHTASVTITVYGTAPIVPGVWHATTGSGFSFDFTVDANADYVTQIQYFWSGLSCDGVTYVSGSVTYTPGGGRPITARQFTLDPPPDYPTITGTFDDDGTAASGEWQWLSCSGTWQGAPL
jgi:uncharacterized protein YjdB